jgi:DNA-binding SARP family transcriptional activator
LVLTLELARRPRGGYVPDTNELDFRVLGPLQVASNGSFLPLGGAKQRAVLALLLLHANEVVSVDQLIDALWGDSPPASAANVVQGYVSHLRKTLEPGRVRGEHEIIVSRPPGYSLRIGQGALDADRFIEESREGQRLLEDGDAGPAAQRLRAALDLWRGPAFADLVYEPFLRLEAERLEELRLAALEERIDADLALGRERDLVGELRELVTGHPLRERLRGQLMVALYRSGRQAEALEVFREGRRTLDDTLGIEPSPALRELERAILQQDPALGGKSPAPAAPSRRRGRLVSALAIAAALAAAVAVAVVIATRASPRTRAPVAVYPDSVAAIDPASNSVVDDILVGDYPLALAADTRYIYAGNEGDATVSYILPETRRVYGVSAFSRATDLTADGGDLWAADGGAPGHTPPGVGPGTVLDQRPGPSPTTITVGPNRDATAREGEEQTTLAADGPDSYAVWVGNQDTATVREIDRVLDKTVLTIRGVAPGGLAAVGHAGSDTVWASEPTHNLVVRIDAGAGRVIGRTRIPDQPNRLAADSGSVWVVTRGAEHALWRINAATGRAVARIPLAIAPRRVMLGAGSVWVSGYRRPTHAAIGRGGAVVRVDPTTNRIVATIPLGDLAPDGMVMSHNLVWVAVAPLERKP